MYPQDAYYGLDTSKFTLNVNPQTRSWIDSVKPAGGWPVDPGIIQLGPAPSAPPSAYDTTHSVPEAYQPPPAAPPTPLWHWGATALGGGVGALAATALFPGAISAVLGIALGAGLTFLGLFLFT